MRVVLPSNSSLSNYPNNSLTTYTVKFSNPLDLSVGQYECGLSEIQFYKSWLNVTDCYIEIDHKNKKYTIPIPDGHYDTPEALITLINTNISLYSTTEIANIVKFEYSEITRKAIVVIALQVERRVGINVQPNKKLSELLGMKEVTVLTIPAKSDQVIVEGKEIVKLDYIHNLMVYCDVIQSSTIGDTEAPLLRSVSVDAGHWQNQCTIYQKIQYLPISRTKTGSITIYLRDDTGQPIPFTNGRTVVTLDFRRVKPLHTY